MLDDARAVVADSAALSLDDALLAAAEGDGAALDRALARVFQEGESPVSVIRALLRHLQRLHLLAAQIAGGRSVDEAMRAARPPIFFKQQDSYRRQLTRWSEAPAAPRARPHRRGRIPHEADRPPGRDDLPRGDVHPRPGRRAPAAADRPIYPRRSSASTRSSWSRLA